LIEIIRTKKGSTAGPVDNWITSAWLTPAAQLNERLNLFERNRKGRNDTNVHEFRIQPRAHVQHAVIPIETRETVGRNGKEK
jgi:hypothetical protein